MSVFNKAIYYVGVERNNVDFDKRIYRELKLNCVAPTMRMFL